jgi:hypothetical protein
LKLKKKIDYAKTERKKCQTLKKTKLLNARREYSKGKGKLHPFTGTEALYRPYGP